MEARKLAPTVGTVACALVLVVLAVPYALIDPPSAVTTYYTTGAITPFAAGLLPLVALVVLAAGREERSDPALTAGAALVFGAFIAVVAVVWAVTVPRGVVTQLSTAVYMDYHRWLLALVSLGVPAGAGWYARTLGLV